MHQLRHAIARLILAVFLATIFSPSFGWDVVSSHLDHDHIVFLADAEHFHDHDGHDQDSHTGHDRAGHVLAHMPATVGPLDLALPPLPDRQWYASVLPIVLPSFPTDFLRPPDAALLA